MDSKYLDKEDIEDLGFTDSEYYRDGGSYRFHKGNYALWCYRYNTIQNTPDRIMIVRSDEDPKKCGSVFDGDIKNKSQLKQVLKMLDIL